MKTCLNRLIGNCKNCTPDYNPQNHPNNYNCRNYHEVNLLSFDIKDKTLEERTK
jgi:hypothetical protein